MSKQLLASAEHNVTTTEQINEPQPASGSILGTVADHEKKLLADIESSEHEAREIIEDARGEARVHAQTEEAKLTEEVARIRREAESARQAQFDATVQAAEERLSGVRESTSSRTSEMAEKVLSLFVPRMGGAR